MLARTGTSFDCEGIDLRRIFKTGRPADAPAQQAEGSAPPDHRDPVDMRKYISGRLDESIRWYERSSVANRVGYYGCQGCSIFFAALIPFLSGLNHNANNQALTLWTGVLGVVIAVSTAASSVARFHEMWIKHRTTAEALKREKHLYEMKVTPYDKAPDGPDALLVQRIETLLAQENSEWAQTMAQPGPKDGVA